MGEYPLAYKEFLRVIEMSEGLTREGKEGNGGAGRRAAVGVKLVRFASATSFGEQGRWR